MSTPFDTFDLPSSPPAISKPAPPSAALSLARVAIWGVVTLWCMVPIVWLIFTMATSGNRQAAPIQRPMGNLEAQLISSAFMFGAFSYGVWCSVGVVMGIGFERAIDSLHSLSAVIRGK